MHIDTGDVIIIILMIITFILCIVLANLITALDERDKEIIKLKVKLAHLKVRYNKLRKYYKGKEEV